MELQQQQQQQNNQVLQQSPHFPQIQQVTAPSSVPAVNQQQQQQQQQQSLQQQHEQAHIKRIKHQINEQRRLSDQMERRKSSMIIGQPQPHPQPHPQAQPQHTPQSHQPQPSSQFTQAQAQQLNLLHQAASSSGQLNLLHQAASSSGVGEEQQLMAKFYRPKTKKSKKSSLAGEKSSTSISAISSEQHHVAFNMPPSFTDVLNLKANHDAARRASESASPHCENSTSSTSPVPHDSGKSSSATGGKQKRRYSSTTHTSTLSYEEVAKCANACTTDQKIVWVARQALGSGGSNGFTKATSNVQRMKKQKVRSFKLKTGGGGVTDEEQIKLATFDQVLAKKVVAEIKVGLQYSNLMTDTIRSILEEIDPTNPVLLVQPPAVVIDGVPDEKRDHKPIQQQQEMQNDNNRNVSPASTMTPEEQAGFMHGSTFRKARNTSNTPSHNIQEVIKIVGDHSNEGKKLSKKELSHRIFEYFRFRSLAAGDYVAVMLSHDRFALARVAQNWNSAATYSQLARLTEADRNAVFTERVYVQEPNEYSRATGSARMVNREHILPLPRSIQEANAYGTKIRKGYRIYAMYPRTTNSGYFFLCATVVDAVTYCQKEDE